VPSVKTALTELGTALGLFWQPDQSWPQSVESIDVPGIPAEEWRPVVAPALTTGARDRDLLTTALSNGRAFRTHVLGGRAPRLVEWTGADKSVWSSEIPRDLIVDEVWFIQAKHDSTCVLNTSPYSVFELLTAETDIAVHQSWYHDVAPHELEAYYDAVRNATAPGELPLTVAELGRPERTLLKQMLRQRTTTSPDELARYAELCRVVSQRTADRWQARLARATPGQRTRLFLRMLRISGGPYWLLGAKGNEALRLHVCDTRRWRNRFTLTSFVVDPAHAGQPQVDWHAVVTDRSDGRQRSVRGFCEIRWSHGKLQGSPECKVQVTTPLEQLPGYDRFGS
jgi:hypothetical protein